MASIQLLGEFTLLIWNLQECKKFSLTIEKSAEFIPFVPPDEFLGMVMASAIIAGIRVAKIIIALRFIVLGTILYQVTYQVSELIFISLISNRIKYSV